MSLAFVISLLGVLSQAEEGGESMAMDGFGAAESLYQQDPEVSGTGQIIVRRIGHGWFPYRHVQSFSYFLVDVLCNLQ